MMESEVDALLNDLVSGDPDRALASFGKLKATANASLSSRLTPILSLAIERKDFLLRDHCCELLLESDGQNALSSVIEAMIPDLGDDQNTLAFLVSERVSSEPSLAKPIVVGYLLDPRPEARATATWALGFLNDPESLPHLRASLADPEPQVRAQAMGALGSFTEVPGVVEWLLAGLSDPSASVRMNAVSALRLSEDPEALEPLLTTLLRTMDDVDSGVRRQAASALGQLGFYEAVDRLQRAAVEDSDPAVQLEAREAIERIQEGGGRAWGKSVL